MTSGKIKLAQIGYGYWGTNVARTVNGIDGVELCYVFDDNEKRQNEAYKQYPFLRKASKIDEVFTSNVDAVLIVTPPETHYQVALKALSANKHVFVEKPFTQNLKQARHLIDLAKGRNLITFVDHVFVYSEPVKFLKNYIESGELGEIFYINSRRINLGLFQYMVDVVWDLAIHDISIIDYLVGFDIEKVSVFKKKYKDFPKEALANINADLKNGTTVSMNVSWLSPVKVREMIFGGSKRTVIYDETSTHRIQIYDHGVLLKDNLDTGSLHKYLVQYKIGDVSFPNISSRQALANSLEHFIDCVRHGKKPLTGEEAILNTIQILETISKV